MARLSLLVSAQLLQAVWSVEGLKLQSANTNPFYEENEKCGSCRGGSPVPLTPNSTPAQLFELPNAVALGAVCIDGSPYKYYIRPGSGAGANKWYIHHQGGGWCMSPRDCLGRSKGGLGSSKSFGAQTYYDYDYFSQDPEVNPLMHDWNSVYLNYCDGGSFSGHRVEPLDVDGTPLYFRGGVILQNVIKDLLTNHGLNAATEVVIGGSSAGGLSTYFHLDTWASQIPATARVTGLPECGYFLEWSSGQAVDYKKGMQWVYSTMNSTTNAGCMAMHAVTSDQWRCIFAEHVVPYIRTPFYALQSRFDSWQADNVVVSRDADKMNPFGDECMARLMDTMTGNPQNGMYLDSCFHHCGRWTVMHVDGYTQAQAHLEWYQGRAKNPWRYQIATYPCDSCCN
eukprot:comp20540_c0_seq1/m.26340 comp20540_c0_seq1/g.26340  ORF comp20540_c0_seq1/g.26340 comp20540_c0_seq1/m.26340 type:complete len:397 (-) comp20540_c0_seq1:379-1569(-)